MTYSVQRDDNFIKEFIEHYGAENIPDPFQYPNQFEFFAKSYEHYKTMQEMKKGQ